MSALDQLAKMKTDIDQLTATLERVSKVLESTQSRHNEEIAEAVEAVEDVKREIEAKRFAWELANAVKIEMEGRREEEKSLELQYFLTLRAAITSGSPTTDDADTYANDMGYDLESPEEKEEDEPPPQAVGAN